MKSLLLAFLLPLQAGACIWLDGTTFDGSTRRLEGWSHGRQLESALLENPEDRLDELTRLGNGTNSNVAPGKELEGVRELLSGNAGRAVEILGQLETEQPGRYSTAANLGTAHELNGDLEAALKWIREGIRRNPDSHQGTEWLHAEILRTRIKLREDPAFLRNHHVISLPDSFSAETPVRTGDDQRTVAEIGVSIFYQLRERMIFVKPPDPVVADLLFTLGRIEARTRILESGIQLLGMSRDYGFSNPERLDAEIRNYEQAIRSAKFWRSFRIACAVTAVAAGFILFLTVAWRKKWFFLTHAAWREHRPS